MNKGMFMKRLQELLEGLPQQEAKEAIQYYEDYFADAGKENEAKVIRELGSPEKVAENIRAELGMPSEEEDGLPSGAGSADAQYAGQASASGGGNTAGTYSDNGGNTEIYTGSVGTHSGSAYNTAGEAPEKKSNKTWIIVAACTFYIWIPLLFSAFAILFAAAVSILAVGFAFGVTGLALLAAAFALAASSFVKLFISPAGAMVMLGAGLMLAGMGIYFWIFVGFLFGKWIPALCRGIGSLIGKVRGKRGEAA